MSATATATAIPTDLGSLINGGGGVALHGKSNMSLGNFVASLTTALVLFGIQFLAFYLLRPHFARIYSPRTYLVPDRLRVSPPPSGLFAWITPIFRTSTAQFVDRCGPDAFLFLRYLRLLLKVFVPLAMVLLTVLLPVNKIGAVPGVSGLDSFAWQNVAVPNKVHRLWAHLVMAIVVVCWACYQFYIELRMFIRLRQSILTSPEHRIRASATTVLVQSIPRKWLTVEALDALYDVFPGGVRQIWINRDYDELSDKIKARAWYAKKLEQAETDLVRNCMEKHEKEKAKEEKKAGIKRSRSERKADAFAKLQRVTALANSDAGITAGDPHEVSHTLEEALGEAPRSSSRSSSPAPQQRHPLIPIPIIGQGLEAVGHGIGAVRQGVKGVGKKVAGGVVGGLAKSRREEANYVTGNTAQDGQLDGPDEPLARAGEASPALDHPLEAPGDHLYKGPEDENRDSRLEDSARRRGHETSSSEQSRLTDFSNRERIQNAQNTLSTSADPEKAAAEPPAAPVAPSREAESSHSKVLDGPRRFLSKRKMAFPSPQPFHGADDEYPLSSASPTSPTSNRPSTYNEKRTSNPPPTASQEESEKQLFDMKKEYPAAYVERYGEDDDNASWRKYLKPSDRETMRLPLLSWSWWPTLPFIGKKVDVIYHCRKELARLNQEIAIDQAQPEKYPLMNSAFIQFNHQVAAHMACQSLSHHMPQSMAPRLVEIDPRGVIWDNLSIKWWERYLRTTLVLAAIVGLIICWGFPVSLTGLLSQLNFVAGVIPWLHWVLDLPNWLLNIIQGVLPPLLLTLLTLVLPMVLRLLSKLSGLPTRVEVELRTQNFYFAFLFVQVFVVVSISSGITATIQGLIKNPLSVPQILAVNLPKASNYFFSYLILQALTISAGTLAQVWNLIQWVFLARWLDKTPREKFARAVDLPSILWGSFFPIYTNFAVIGLVFSVIAPLITLFMVLTFSLFWIVYRYNMLYVTTVKVDTGGLLYPKAINHLFTGLYFMELCLIGLFFLVRDTRNKVAAAPQAIIMIVVLALTILFQWLLNKAFGPLFHYLPITFEDEAARRDEEFNRALEQKFAEEKHEVGTEEAEQLEERELEEGQDLNDILENAERREQDQDKALEKIEMKNIEARRGVRDNNNTSQPSDEHTDLPSPPNRPDYLQHESSHDSWKARHSWADRSSRATGLRPPGLSLRNSVTAATSKRTWAIGELKHRQTNEVAHADTDPDPESQRRPEDDFIFSGVQDAVEDLDPSKRDKLIKRAFQHVAMRTPRPAIWVPQDDLGISDDEVRNTQRFSQNIWITNRNAALDPKGRIIFCRPPPDMPIESLLEL